MDSVVDMRRMVWLQSNHTFVDYKWMTTDYDERESLVGKVVVVDSKEWGMGPIVE